MHLGDQRSAITLQPLDDVHLPQRAVGIELAAHGGRHERVELRPAPRRRQARPGEVVVQFEIGVVDPHRVMEPQRHPQCPLPEGGQQRHPLCNDAADLRVPRGRREERTRALRRVQDHHQPNVQRRRGCLQRQEGRVQSLERFHVPVWPKPPAPRAASPRPSASTSAKDASSTRTMTSWAMRSPRFTA